MNKELSIRGENIKLRITDMCLKLSAIAGRKLEYVAFILPSGVIYVEHFEELPYSMCLPCIIGERDTIKNFLTEALGDGETDDMGDYWKYEDRVDQSGRERTQLEMLHAAQSKIEFLRMWQEQHPTYRMLSLIDVIQKKKFSQPFH